MTLKQIASLGRKLSQFLFQFADCFVRAESRACFRCYVQGQMSGIQRKNCEAMALESRLKFHPRTLQRFIESMSWNEERVRDRCQQMVANEYLHPDAIGCVDESGVTKSGRHTVGADRQYNGSRGKLDNCVMGVHLSFAAPGFHVLLDSRVYLTESYCSHRARRRENHVPEEIVYRTKPQLAMELIRHALNNGIRVAAWTFDEGYGRDGGCLDALEELRQAYVAEVPANFMVGLCAPRNVRSESQSKAVGDARRPRWFAGCRALARSPIWLDMLRRCNCCRGNGTASRTRTVGRRCGR